MTISRFEDIQAWQGARGLCRGVYELSGESQFVKDFGLRDQARRAAVSIMANIAEGGLIATRTSNSFSFCSTRFGQRLNSRVIFTLPRIKAMRCGRSSIKFMKGQARYSV